MSDDIQEDEDAPAFEVLAPFIDYTNIAARLVAEDLGTFKPSVFSAQSVVLTLALAMTHPEYASALWMHIREPMRAGLAEAVGDFVEDFPIRREESSS